MGILRAHTGRYRVYRVKVRGVPFNQIENMGHMILHVHAVQSDWNYGSHDTTSTWCTAGFQMALPRLHVRNSRAWEPTEDRHTLSYLRCPYGLPHTWLGFLWSAVVHRGHVALGALGLPSPIEGYQISWIYAALDFRIHVPKYDHIIPG